MGDDKIVKQPEDGGKIPADQQRGGGRVPPDPPELHDDPPPDNPPLPLVFQALTLQRVALAVFVGLALAIVLVTLVALLIPQDEQKSLAISRTMTVLLITALACAAIAWFDRSNSMMLGRGVRHLLSIQRAAVASFVGASVATVGVAIFVALSALFAGGLEKGLYALASIEFLLKLAAVSAIIVLMTLRKPLVASVAPAKQEGDGDPPAVDVDREDNGRLEFGGLSFAFSLVVIAALIVPGEDLMRMASMFFGGQQKLEQYLPTRPVVTVEDDLSNQIARAVVQSIATRQLFADLSLPELEREIDSLALQNQIFGVIANNLINNVERRGALTLLREVCDDNEDTLIFANSDDRVLAEHIAFLAAEGLIDQPYGDLNSIKITNYGSSVVKNSTGGNCKDTASTVLLAESSDDDPSITTTPYEITLTLPAEGSIFALGLPPDRYRAELVAIDRTDPVLELLTAEGTIIQTDDDGGPGFLDAGLDFVVTSAEQKLILRASTIGGQGGRASLRLFRAPPPQANFPSTAEFEDGSHIDTFADMRVIGTVPHSQPLSITTEGTVLELDLDSGTFKISLSAVGDADPILELFDASGSLLEASDDETGMNAALTLTVADGDRYFIRASNYRGVPGEAVLYVDHAPADPAAVAVLGRPAVPLPQTAEIPPSGTAFYFEALTTGEHSIQTARPTGAPSSDDDLVGFLFRGTAEDYSQIASDDDSGLDRFPVISARLTAGETYLLVLRHYGSDAKATPVAISVTPRVASAAPAQAGATDASTEGADTATEQTPAAVPAETAQETPASPVAPSTTDSGDSQSDP